MKMAANIVWWGAATDKIKKERRKYEKQLTWIKEHKCVGAIQKKKIDKNNKSEIRVMNAVGWGARSDNV